MAHPRLQRWKRTNDAAERKGAAHHISMQAEARARVEGEIMRLPHRERFGDALGARRRFGKPHGMQTPHCFPNDSDGETKSSCQFADSANAGELLHQLNGERIVKYHAMCRQWTLE